MVVDPRKISNPVTANQRLFDSTIRHQIGVRRLQSGEANKILKLLEEADREIVRKIRLDLAKNPGVGIPGPIGRLRTEQMLREIRVIRRELMIKLEIELTDDLIDLAGIEAQTELRLLNNAIPIDIDLVTPTVKRLTKIVTTRPFQGRILKDWAKGLEIVDRSRLTRSVQLGMFQGETIQQIAARIGGTRAGNFQDGVLAITRRQATALARTAVNHVSNAAREEVWNANEDIIEALVWISTLDGRTSAICRSRDGRMAPIGGKPLPQGAKPLIPSGARPPAHFQ